MSKWTSDVFIIDFVFSVSPRIVCVSPRYFLNLFQTQAKAHPIAYPKTNVTITRETAVVALKAVMDIDILMEWSPKIQAINLAAEPDHTNACHKACINAKYTPKTNPTLCVLSIFLLRY